MSWQIDGTFRRTNTDFEAGPNGELWTQDLQASIKIIASRHDFHDQDLALGIAATLNLDGLNSMRADLKMGGFKLQDVGAGSLVTDGVRFGQLIDSGSFDEPLRQLTLHTPDGDLPPIVIPSGAAGGGGTVTEITIGEGLSGAANPITSVGDIQLEEISTPITESNGIKSLTVDKFGRVTQVIGGALDPGGGTGSQTSWEKSVTVESPSSSEDITWFYTVRQITLLSIHAVLMGNTSPSVGWRIMFAPSRTDAGTEIQAQTTTSTTTGDNITVITEPVIPANQFVWVESTSASGVVDELHLTCSGAIG